MFELLVAFALLLYCIQSTMILIGVRRIRRSTRHESEPTVTIIVAARNEENHLGRCIESLVNLQYPHEKLEILIVDDNSTDHTAAVIAPFLRKYPFLRSFTAGSGDGSIKGKANAVAQAIERSTGEIILQTDADCSVQPEWIRETVCRYDESTGVVGGFTMLKATTWFESIQALDWAYLFSVAAAGIGWNKPLTIVGNHLTYRRKTYEDVGGYRSIKFSVTEDYALVRAVSDRTKWKFGFSLSPTSVVTSLPCTTMHDLYRQRVRWGVGGLEMKFRGLAVMAVGFILHALIVLGLVLGRRPDLIAGIFVLKTIADVIVLALPLRVFGALRLIRYILHFELYFIVYVIALPFAVALHQKIKWKGRTY